MEKKRFDVAIIGGGPGGYVAAIRAAQRGLTTCLIEAKQVGGTCLNRGCIPSKALIKSAEFFHQIKEAKTYGIDVEKCSFDYKKMAARKDQIVSNMRKSLESLIKSNQITLYHGYGKLLSSTQIKVQGQDDLFVEADRIILATGSEPRELPSLPYDYERVHDSTSLLALETLPKSIVIVGGGVIGCEFASLYCNLGLTVTLVELLPIILSTEGEQIASQMKEILQKKGIRILTSTSVTTIDRSSKELLFHLSEGSTLTAESALISVGRTFNTDRLGLEKVGVIVNGNGTIDVNEQMQTNQPHIYAIGDITGKWLLAHVASHQGLVAADHIAGLDVAMDYDVVPSVIFTNPEVASVGYTLERAKAAGYEAIMGAFPFQALGKAQATGYTEGFSQIVADKVTGQILGAQVIGYDASTLIAEIAVAMRGELTLSSIHETIHAHPTYAESWMEAAFLTDQLPLHLPPKKKVTR